jgi:hypothetical protein
MEGRRRVGTACGCCASNRTRPARIFLLNDHHWVFNRIYLRFAYEASAERIVDAARLGGRNLDRLSALGLAVVQKHQEEARKTRAVNASAIGRLGSARPNTTSATAQCNVNFNTSWSTAATYVFLLARSVSFVPVHRSDARLIASSGGVFRQKLRPFYG